MSRSPSAGPHDVPRPLRLRQALDGGDLDRARELLLAWMRDWAAGLPPRPSRAQLRQPLLWDALADYVDRSGEHQLIERLWQLLDRLPPPEPDTPPTTLPLLGVPILNGPDLLERMLASLDVPVHTLAVVDNSAGADDGAGTPEPAAVSGALERIRERGHPLVGRIRIARPFANLGVAASWNLILSSFPGAPLALLANHDVQFAPGVLAEALRRVDPARPQLLPLLPQPQAFSAFLITALCWDRLGLFDAGFHPAYCEDLDYRDRLQADPAVQHLDGGFAHPAMEARNREHSATLARDPALQHHNRTSYALNKLWYLSERRHRRDPRGGWRRLWLAQWCDDPPTP